MCIVVGCIALRCLLALGGVEYGLIRITFGGFIVTPLNQFWVSN